MQARQNWNPRLATSAGRWHRSQTSPLSSRLAPLVGALVTCRRARSCQAEPAWPDVAGAAAGVFAVMASAKACEEALI